MKRESTPKESYAHATPTDFCCGLSRQLSNAQNTSMTKGLRQRRLGSSSPTASLGRWRAAVAARAAGFGGATRGGARPQTAEIIKTFGERCPGVIVNNKQEKADYVVLLDHEGGKGLILHDNKVAVFNKDGDSIVSHSTRSLGNAVKDACEAITSDWPTRRAALMPRRASPAAEGGNDATAPRRREQTPGGIEVVSTPPGADIEIDGNFVGSTPSTLRCLGGAASGRS